MLKTNGRYLSFSDGWGTSWKVVDRRLQGVKQDVIHFRETTVGERRYWDAQVAGTQISRAVLVPYQSSVEEGDVFVIGGEQYEVVQKDRKDTLPSSWLLSLKKAVIQFGTS